MNILKVVILFILSGQILAQPDRENALYHIQNAGEVNTKVDEFSPTWWEEFVIYIRPSGEISTLTGSEHFDLYVTAPLPDGHLDKYALLSNSINSPLHEGPATFDPTTQSLIFSSIMWPDTIHEGQDLPPNMLFISTYDNGAWSTPKMLDINVPEAQSCHPAISSDGQRLVFASEREGGFGYMDLYISKKDGLGWTKPVNLGPQINSAGHELFPFVDPAGHIYFARENTQSGLDIYKASFENGRYTEPRLLPPPLNGPFDDFGLIIGHDGTYGYFSSNRPGGKGGDDLYHIYSDEPLFEPRQENIRVVSFEVVDLEGKKLEDASLYFSTLVDENHTVIDPDMSNDEKLVFLDSIKTDRYGYAVFEGPLSPLVVHARFPGKKTWKRVLLHDPEQPLITVFMEDADPIKEVTISPSSSTPAEELDEARVGTIITFNNIYYDYNSAVIKRGAAYELDALVQAMKANPDLIVELRSHTDARGDAAYNQALSEKRALAAKQYLVDKDIDPDRIQTIGFGEVHIRNHCVDGVHCSEADHIYNRRTEVVILAK